MTARKPLVIGANGLKQQIQAGDTIPLSCGGTGGTDAASTKANLALDLVENKSAATILAGLTSANVTNALGYTPAQQGSGGGGSSITTGTATLDFGTGQGLNEASVAVTGLTAITAANIPHVRFELVATASRTINDHKYAALFIALSVGPAVAGSGFTINGVSLQKITGAYTVRWFYF